MSAAFSGKEAHPDPENAKFRKLSYVPIGEVEQSVNKTISYCVMGTVPAGISEVNEYNDWQEGDDLDFDPKTHFYLSIDKEFGYSMMPLVGPGDKVLVSFNSKVKDGDLVAARWDKTKGALKIYTENKDV
ncbi:hypothetical protein HGB07_00610, partial [Candidatus Roizmanbacteria bacterium]|nr:hypothetical protein [Candidatus Roizmanbacteria bacterium]